MYYIRPTINNNMTFHVGFWWWSFDNERSECSWTLQSRSHNSM